jgi:hypothetical protein
MDCHNVAAPSGAFTPYAFAAPETRKPILVDSLNGVTHTGAGAPNQVPAVVASGFESELTKLQSTIEAQKGVCALQMAYIMLCSSHNIRSCYADRRSAD